MILPLVLLAALGPSADAEAAAAHTLNEQFEKIGRSAPALDPELTRAARTLAARALDGTAADAAELLTLTAAVSEAGGFDPTPRALVLRGAPATEPLAALARRDDLASEPCSHVGIGALKKGDLLSLVVLLADRRMQLAAFPRVFPKSPPPQRLCFKLLEPLKTAEVFVTRPAGGVDKVRATEEKGRLCAPLTFPTLGRHTVEVLARGDRGPQVAGMFFVQVGEQASSDLPLAEREPKTVPEARARVTVQINALRAANALSVLEADFELDAVAQAYADRLAKENFFAHVAPDGEDLKARMTRAGYHYTIAGENLGLASGPLAAHFSIEHSPGHRKNLLDPAYTHVGSGVTKNALGQTLLVEVLATPAPGPTDEDPAVEAAEAIAQARKLRGLKPLARAGVLDQLAATHARHALELNTPKAKLPNENLHDRVFAARDDLTTASVDFFVTDSPALVTDSKNLFDPRATLVGIGVAKGDSSTYGAAKFWVVVIYASTLE